MTSRSNRCEALSGTSADPSALVTTRPLSTHAGPSSSRSSACRRFQCDDVPADLDPDLTDRKRAAVEVDVGPRQAERLGATQPAERDHMPQRVQLVVAG